MSLGSRIRELRRVKGITQAQLAEMVGSEANTVSRWELDKLGMRKDYVVRFAKALGTSVAFLLEETDNPSTKLETEQLHRKKFITEAFVQSFMPFNFSDFNMSLTSPDFKGLKKLPILNRLDSDKCNNDILSYHIFSSEVYGIFDPKHPPFIVRVEDDSMKEAGIYCGAIVVVNPAERVNDGEAALVCWGCNHTAIKLVYWHSDGTVELHSANPAYLKVYRFSKDDCDNGNFSIKGKIMWSAQRPKRMI